MPFLGALAVFFMCIAVLYGGENVGLSDNGDFRRVMLTNNIEYKDDTDRYYRFTQEYKMDLGDADGFFSAAFEAWKTSNDELYSSPQFLMIKLSKELNVIANAVSGRDLSDYNIFYMAVMYSLMLAVASFAIFTFFADVKLRIRLPMFLLFVFMFCDAGYLLYFNSFYGEALQFTALMMLIGFGMLIYKSPSLPKVIGFFVSLYFFAGSKLANIPFSLIAALLAVLMVIMRRDIKFKLGVILSATVCIMLTVGLLSSIPDWMSRDTTYQAVFYGILRESDDPEADLAELGVDEKYAVLANTTMYMEDDEYPLDMHSEEFERDFYEKVSKLDIAGFYLRHSIRLIGELSMAIENSAYIRPPGLGNMSDESMVFTEKWSGWSHLRTSLKFLYEPWVVFAAFIILTAYMVFINIFYIYNHRIESPERKYMICALDVLIFGLWINLALPVLTNGAADIAKHMFLFVNCVDILFFVCVMGIMTLPFKKMCGCVTAAAVLTGLFYVRIPPRKTEFGRLNGEPIKWQIAERYEDGSMLLVSDECVGRMPFDEGTNDWETSELREWLNGGFLDEFTDAEKSRIMDTENSVILPYSQKDRAEAGDHAHYWNYTRSMAAEKSGTAYHYYLDDRVFIPTIDMAAELDAPDGYWVMCPYCGNEQMERFVNDDGFVLHADVRNEKGVRAVIRLSGE